MKKLPLNLHYLKYFCDAVKSGSISRAAKLNHVSQSAASQGIAKLEAELATQLISHWPNRFRITPEGKKLFESAQAIFQAVKRTEDEISGFKEATLTFACTHSFALTYLPRYLKLAKELLPHIQLNLRFGHYHTIKEMIKKGIVDFAFLIDNDNLTPFDCYPIFKGEYALFAAKGAKNIEKLSFLLDNEERMETNILKYEEGIDGWNKAECCCC